MGVETQTIGAQDVGTMPAGVSEQKLLKLDAIDREYFPPSDLPKASELVKRINETIPAKVIRYNFDPEKDQVPDGYGLAIVPIAERIANANVTVSLVIAVAPDPELIAGHEKGAAYIRETITDSFLTKIANAARPKPNGSIGTLPKTVEEYIERRKGKESLKVFTELAPGYVKALREKGLRVLTQQLLRQVLQSAVFSTQFNPALEDKGTWNTVLTKMIARAKTKGLDPAVLINWQETRDEAEMVNVEELDIDALDQLIA